ncbi:MAG: hypothetical protein AAFQ68_06135 [Bacteroidota bacterium]
MQRTFSVFSLLLCFGLLLALPQELRAAKKKKLSLVENDKSVNDPDYCNQEADFCLAYGSTDTLELKISTQDQQRPRLEVSIFDPETNTTIWQSQASNISLISPQSTTADTFTFEIILDLSNTFGSNGRHRLFVSGFESNINSFTDGSGNSPPPNVYVFDPTPICVKDQCTGQGQIVCPCAGTLPGSFSISAGQQLPQFDPTGVTRGDVRFNTTNKFIGLQYNTYPKGIYYQAELQLAQLRFGADDTIRDTPGAPALIETRTHDQLQIYLVPLQFRLRIGRFASVGVGGALSYVLNYRVDEIDTVFPGSAGDRLEPEVFGDFRLGNARKGLQLGYRVARRWSGLDDLTGDQYRLGKVYLTYTF